MEETNQLIRLAEAVVTLRAKLKAATAAADEIKKDKTTLENHLLAQMRAQELENFKHDGTLFTASVTRRFSMADRVLAEQFIRENDAIEMLGNTLSSEFVKNYLDEHGQLPPGVQTYNQETLSVRKA